MSFISRVAAPLRARRAARQACAEANAVTGQLRAVIFEPDPADGGFELFHNSRFAGSQPLKDLGVRIDWDLSRLGRVAFADGTSLKVPYRAFSPGHAPDVAAALDALPACRAIAGGLQGHPAFEQAGAHRARMLEQELDAKARRLQDREGREQQVRQKRRDLRRRLLEL